MALIGACGAQYTLKFHTGNHIGIFGILMGLIMNWIKSGKPWRKDYCACMEGQCLFLLFKVDCMRGTEFFTGPALSLLEIDTIVLVNSKF